MPWPLVPISADRQRPSGFRDIGAGCERGENELTQPAAGSPTSWPQHHGLTNGTWWQNTLLEVPVQWCPFVLLNCEPRQRKSVCCDSSASPWILAESRRQQGLHLLLPVRQLRLREAKPLWYGHTVARSHSDRVTQRQGHTATRSHSDKVTQTLWNERRAEHRASGSRIRSMEEPLSTMRLPRTHLQDCLAPWNSLLEPA